MRRPGAGARALRPALLVAALALGGVAAPLAAQAVQSAQTTNAAAPAWKQWTPWKLWERWTSTSTGGFRQSWARWRERKEWKEFDVNDDGAFDREDMNEILGMMPWAPSLDVNGDGRKDMRDALDLSRRHTRWDRNADGRVTAEDFARPKSVTIPAPDAAAAKALAVRVLKESQPKIPSDLEAKLRQEWRDLAPADDEEWAVLYEQAAMRAMIAQNLEVTQWAFARAATLAPHRASALSSLGFTLSQQERFGEALVLLSRARALEPTACIVHSNIGYVLSRHAQTEQARTHYQKAVELCPERGQLHLNLGATLLRLGDEAGAESHFNIALRQNPRDAEALAMAMTMTTPTEPNLSQYAAEYEKERQEALASEPDTSDEPWEELSTAVKIEQIARQADLAAAREYRAVRADLVDRTKTRIRDTAKTALPDGKSYCADMQKWAANYRAAMASIAQTRHDANRESYTLALLYQRKGALAVFGHERLFLRLALDEAQRAMNGVRNSADAHDTFLRTFDDLYSTELERATRLLKSTHVSYSIHANEADPENWSQAISLAPVGMAVMAASVPGYAPEGQSCAPEPESSPLKDLSIGFEGPGVAFDYKPSACELKLQGGLGVLVALTWSPQNGFGFQDGYGVSDPLTGASYTNFTKHGSDGSITEETEIGAGQILKWSTSKSRVIFAADSEPVGTFNWLGAELGCPKRP